MVTAHHATLVCDVPDERRGEHRAHRTVRFMLDSKNYEMDACMPHYRDMALAFAPFTDAARPARPRQPKRPVAGRRRAAAIRSWARSQGLDVSDRGRISAGILAQYEA